jgi:hypothetical protein
MAVGTHGKEGAKEILSAWWAYSKEGLAMSASNDRDWQIVIGYKDGHDARIRWLTEDEARNAVQRMSSGLKTAAEPSNKSVIVDAAGALIDVTNLRYAFAEPATP